MALSFAKAVSVIVDVLLGRSYNAGSATVGVLAGARVPHCRVRTDNGGGGAVAVAVANPLPSASATVSPSSFPPSMCLCRSAAVVPVKFASARYSLETLSRPSACLSSDSSPDRANLSPPPFSNNAF
ncbi:hypothetical protein PWT90_09588 [Aphanocladium album]|nr:hypothetical protein PWT90_09588 [Aphanocladium album]